MTIVFTFILLLRCLCSNISLLLVNSYQAKYNCLDRYSALGVEEVVFGVQVFPETFPASSFFRLLHDFDFGVKLTLVTITDISGYMPDGWGRETQTRNEVK